MSIGTEDYIVFDYQRYAWKILPAVEQLAQGNQLPLHSFIMGTLHRKEKLYAYTPFHLNGGLGNSWEPIAYLFDTLARHQELADADVLDEDAIVNNVISLKGTDPDDDLLKTYLLTVYCCEVLPWSPGWNWPYHGNFLLDHDEWIGDWHAYTHRNQEQAALWENFARPVPEPLGQYLQPNFQQQHLRGIRSIRTSHLRGEISGFITTEEIHYMLEHVRTHEILPIEMLISYFKEKEYKQQYWQCLWMIEEEILYRMRYALAHGKGILTYYVN